MHEKTKNIWIYIYPSQLFDYFSISPGDIFSIHQECCRNLHRDLLNLRQKGARVGVALNPGTSVEVLDYIIEDVDVILELLVMYFFYFYNILLQAFQLAPV